VGGLAYGFWSGTGAEELGLTEAIGDFDADGLLDIAVSAYNESTLADTAGGVYLFAPAETAVPAAGTSADATGRLLGSTETGLFGYVLATVPDLTGDGADELLVSELYGESGYGKVWLEDGERAFTTTDPESAALLAWAGEADQSLTGNALAVGDLDADGLPDFVICAYGYASDGATTNGRVYVLLSSR
jgi:hypothetical protein